MKRLLLTLCLAYLLLPISPVHAKENEFLVTKVIDGETIMLENGNTVRYLGIEAPSMKRSDGGPEFYAREAVRQNKSLVLMKKVRLEFDVEKKDGRGNLLAWVFVKKLMVNAELVRTGCARVARSTAPLKYRDLLVKNEKEASARYAGLWQEKKKESDLYYIGNKRTYVFHKPSCPLADKIPQKYRIIFRNRTDPISIGYVPCNKCKP
jgi:micrococcal nuclease